MEGNRAELTNRFIVGAFANGRAAHPYQAQSAPPRAMRPLPLTKDDE
jgi:hypothetical protein